MKRAFLAALCVLVHGPLAAQSRDHGDWRYRGDSLPNFKADSSRCSVNAGGTPLTDQVTQWSACIAVAQWVRVRRFPSDACDPLTLHAAGALPAGLTPPAADSILTRLRRGILDHWVPSSKRHWNDWSGQMAIRVTQFPESIVSRPIGAIKGVTDEVPLRLMIRRPTPDTTFQPRSFDATVAWEHMCVGLRERPADGVSEVFHWLQVDRGVQMDRRSKPPPYPSGLDRGIDAEVVAQFVVDTAGRPEPATLQIISSGGAAFTKAVRDNLPNILYIPAEIAGLKVRQVVRQPFQFHH